MSHLSIFVVKNSLILGERIKKKPLDKRKKFYNK